MRLSILYGGILLSLLSCNNLEKGEVQRRKRLNRVVAPIYRLEGERVFDPIPPVNQPPPSYPWEHVRVGDLVPISKEFFRCRGSALHPPLEGGNLDCRGNKEHGLPLRDGKEFIYPILIDILNYIQKHTEQRVIITSGHRCPTHNHYIQPQLPNTYSKHQIGAIVDFYVEGYEEDMTPVLSLITEFYAQRTENTDRVFQKVEGERTWKNREVTIRYFRPQEGRDFDNRHPYPYISLEVCYDTDSQKSVIYDWHTAHKGYIRH